MWRSRCYGRVVSDYFYLRSPTKRRVSRLCVKFAGNRFAPTALKKGDCTFLKWKWLGVRCADSSLPSKVSKKGSLRSSIPGALIGLVAVQGLRSSLTRPIAKRCFCPAYLGQKKAASQVPVGFITRYHLNVDLDSWGGMSSKPKTIVFTSTLTLAAIWDAWRAMFYTFLRFSQVT